MADLSEYDLLRAEETYDAPRARSRAWILAVILGIVVGTAAYFYFAKRQAQAPPAAVAKPVETEVPVQPLGRDAEKITVPPLDASDAVVRELVRKMTAHPAVLSWLATNGLIRNFAVVVTNVADGATPAKHLRAVRPAARFAVVQRNGQTFVDPRTYDRYDTISDAVASIDPAGATRLYATLKPRIEEAYGELGMPPQTFDRALERAIVALLQTPAIDGPIRLESQGGTNYRYADARLEGLTAAQRHLLRTGPRNVRKIQAALRQLAIALGIPASRLPAPH
jgi:hypothetical protein